MAKTLTDLEAELELETDPTEAAVLAGRIVERKSDMAQGATGSPGLRDPGASGGPTPSARPPFKPEQAPKLTAAPAAKPTAAPAPIAPAAPAQAAPVAPPAAAAHAAQTDQLARSALRVSLRPTRN